MRLFYFISFDRVFYFSLIYFLYRTFNETSMYFASDGAFQKPVLFHVWHTLLLSHPFRVLFNQALFRIAVGLLKVQQPALLQLSCPLDIMQYMKRATRVTYDKDQLIKVSLLNDFQCSPQVFKARRTAWPNSLENCCRLAFIPKI